MPAEIYEDVLELEIDLLESIPLTSGSPADWRRSYPYPRLQKTGNRQTISTRVVILENDYLRASVLPDLGGRIWSVFDKRVQADVLPSSQSVHIEEGGSRGVALAAGVVFSPTGKRPLNELGPVEYHIEEAGDADEPAVLWISELLSGSGLSYHLSISLPPDEARLRCVHKTLNRSLYMQRYWLRAFCENYSDCESQANGKVLYDEEAARGLFLSFHEHDRERPFYPRQVETLEFDVVPLSGFAKTPFANSEVALSLTSEKLQISSIRPRLKHKVVLQTEDEQSLEAAVDLYPERAVELSLAGLPSPAKALVLLDEDREEVIRHPMSSSAGHFEIPDEGGPTQEEGQLTGMYMSLLIEGGSLRLYREASYWPQYKPMCHVALGIDAMKRKEFREAAHHLENALLYNAEDHLAWWLKAVAERHAGGGGEERPEILNAHYLAPHEPALRAESFLLQEHQIKEKNSLVSPIAENPDLLVDVACMFYECGLNEDLFHWVEECLRHREVPMLRYLLAAAYLNNSRMEVEAAQQVTLAAKQPINPPYPWRLVERLVIGRLLERFPSDARLRDLMGLMSYGSPA